MSRLGRAAVLIDAERTAQMNRGDHESACRLQRLARLVGEEDEVLDGVARHGHPPVERWHPPGATIGWLARHDPASRRARLLNGLPVPGVQEIDDAT